MRLVEMRFDDNKGSSLSDASNHAEQPPVTLSYEYEMTHRSSRSPPPVPPKDKIKREEKEKGWKSHGGHTLFRPPASHVPLQHTAGSSAAVPMLDIGLDLDLGLILDSSLIPSLPPTGGTLGHHALMGRSLPLPLTTTSPAGIGRVGLIPLPLARSLASSPAPLQVDNGSGEKRGLDVARPNMLRRSSSYEDRPQGVGVGAGARGNRAGVGAGSGPALQGLMGGAGRGGHEHGHGRNWSAGSAETVRQADPQLSALGVSGGGEGSRLAPDRSGMTRRTSSMELVGSNAGSSRSVPGGRGGGAVCGLGHGLGQGHGRTLSDSHSGSPKSYTNKSASSAIPRARPHLARSSPANAVMNATGEKKARAGSLSSTTGESRGLDLGSALLDRNVDVTTREKEKKGLIKVLTTLSALTPVERLPHPPPLPPKSLILNPLSLLTPLAIILEALVWEREVLRGSRPNSKLPLMRDGSSFQISYAPTASSPTDAETQARVREQEERGGELDWRITKAYILAMGMVLDAILPHLQRYAAQHARNAGTHPHNGAARKSDNQKTDDGEAVLTDLLKSIRAYVAKMKKVFGEVAAMYVEGYGFVRGWWDESGMKGAAAEVGRWGDLFDA